MATTEAVPVAWPQVELVVVTERVRLQGCEKIEDVLRQTAAVRNAEKSLDFIGMQSNNSFFMLKWYDWYSTMIDMIKLQEFIEHLRLPPASWNL